MNTASTAAGDEGSITAWIDDAGVYRVEHDRYRMAVSSAAFANQKAVRKWWREHLPLIEKAGWMAYLRSTEPQQEPNTGAQGAAR